MKLFRKLVALLRRDRLESEMAEEMRLHLERRVQENVADGMAPEEASNAALRRFGGVDQVKEACRDQRGWVGLEQFFRDLHFAGRTFCKTPGFTVIAVLTLALGIGLNSAMFSLANTVLLRPLPFPDPSHLVRLYRSIPGNPKGGFSRADYLDLKRDEAGFGRFAGYYFSSIALSELGHPAEWQNSLRVSANFFDTLGLKPQLGRSFRPEEEMSGRNRVLLLSHALWQDRFGGATDIIGRAIRCNGEPFVVIGVLPAMAHDQRIFGNARLFLPLGFTESERSRRDIAFMNILGRRDPGLSPKAGEAFIASFGAHLAADYPVENAKSNWRGVELQASTRKPPVPTLVLMLLGLSGSVLLIACSNLANFLLARAIARTRESAVRTALGASRLRLIRPMVLEAALLAVMGGAGALGVMGWTVDWFNTELVKSGDSPVPFSLDWRVLGFAAAASVLTILFFVVAPAIFTSRINTNNALKSSSHTATVSSGHQRFRHCLIIIQFTFAAILVAGAGFFVRGMDNLLDQPHGWDSDQVVQGYFQLPANTYPAGKRVTEFQRQVVERLQQLPGVQSASLSYGLPYRGLNSSRQYVVEGRPASPDGHQPSVDANGISPGYFEVTGTRLLQGRKFSDADNGSLPKVVIISESMAHAFFPQTNPIGGHVSRVGVKPLESAEIVGVVADVSPTEVEEGSSPFQLYEPLAQDEWHNGDGKLAEMFLAVRTAGTTPETMVNAIRAAIMALDPDLPVSELMPASFLIERTASSMNIVKKLLVGFALLGLLLAVLGIYGVIARTVAQRTTEIGIRMALGAQVSDVMRLILGSGIRLALAGAGLGLIGAFALSRVIGSVLPGMQTNHGPVLVASTVLLVVIAVAACYLPARKASKVDPLIALRAE